MRTSYPVGEKPHNYHPDPCFKRDNFTLLNGEWDFRILKNEATDFCGKITVPFPPESELSGVNRVTKQGEILIYERKFCACINEGKRLLLHFGAVDNEAVVFVNGQIVGGNLGGYIPFKFDITDFLKNGENTLAVNVLDSLDKTYPYGKQKQNRGGMWYTAVSGIWQTVWLEEVPEKYIEGIKITPTLQSVTIEVSGGKNEKVLTLEGESYSFTGDKITLEIDNPKLWTPETPNLYYFTLESGADKINSYFALREVSSEKINGKTVMTLNGKPYFFHALLDQGYFPDGIFTPPSEETFKDDILRMKELGFNTLRKHIKVEPKIFYYYCDLYGMAVFQDFVNNGSYSFLYDTALPTVCFKKLPKFAPKRVRTEFYKTAINTVKLLYNHPSIMLYTIFNEGWGQHNTKNAYNTFKALDSTRLYDTASGWFKTKFTDVQSEHVYFKKADFKIKTDKPCILSEFGGYSLNIKGHCWNEDKTYGYRKCADEKDFTNDLEKLYLTEILPLIKRGLSSSVLTQLSDVEDETNGLLTYDRKVLKIDKTVMKNISEKLKTEFDKISL